MTAPRPPSADDAERDAWLHAALRQAPDAGMDAPAALSATILAAAHASAPRAPAPRRAATPWPARLWHWLAQPAAGAAFASILVATTVGLLWWNRPLPEAERLVPVTQRPVETPGAPTATTAAGAAPEVAPAQANDVPPMSAKASAGAGAKASAAAKAPAPLARRAEPRRERAVVEPMQDFAAQRPQELAAARREAPAIAETTPPASPPPVVALDATMKAARGSDAQTPAPAAPARQALALPAPAVSLGELRASLAVDAAHWSWQRDGAAARPADDALAAWLFELDAATSGHWRRATDGAADTTAPAIDVRLLRDGRAAHRLRLDGDVWTWEPAAAEGATARRWQATVSPAQAQALRTRLDATR